MVWTRTFGGSEVFDPASELEAMIEGLKARIDDTAIIACSGGVDSTVRGGCGEHGGW